jgi:hypothetical protein
MTDKLPAVIPSGSEESFPSSFGDENLTEPVPNLYIELQFGAGFLMIAEIVFCEVA